MTFEVSLRFEERSNICQEAMMIRQPSIDVDKFPRTFALMITTFMNYCLNLTYKQLQYIYLHRLLEYVNFVEKKLLT